MNIVNPRQCGRIVPVKIIDNQVIKLQDLNTNTNNVSSNIFIKKRSKYNTNTFDSKKTLETSYSTNSFQSMKTNNSIAHLSRSLSQKYDKLMTEVKSGEEIYGTVEEKPDYFPTINPFIRKLNLTSQHLNYVSKNKKVLFRKEPKDEFVLKKINEDLYLTIFNKTQPPKRIKIYTRKDIKLITQIQKRYKGFSKREVDQSIHRMRIRQCILESMCLLIEQALDKAYKKLLFERLVNVYHTPFHFENEVYFKDKIDFKLPDKFYNMTKIQKLDIKEKNKIKIYKIKKVKKAKLKSENKK
jgi:hypothetical protein